MPSSIISHQAPALFLKYKYPKKINGTAICLSTMIPDLDLFFGIFFNFPMRNITHSILGIFIWTLPLTIIFSMIFSRYIGPILAKITKKNFFFLKPLEYFGVEGWDKLKFKKFNKRYFIIASYSAIIGGFTHLLLDLPSHEYIELFFPLIILKNFDFLLLNLIVPRIISVGGQQIQLGFQVYDLIWILETIILIFPALYYLRAIKKLIENK